MSDGTDHILIFTDDGEEPTSEVRRGLGSAMKAAAAKASEVTVETLQENMRRFLSGLDEVISASPKEVGGLTLEEVEIHAQIDGKGNVGISGIAGAEVTAHGSIKFVLRKKI